MAERRASRARTVSVAPRVRSIASAVRSALDAPDGAPPPVETLTASGVAIARVKPFEERVRTLDPGTAPVVHAVALTDLGNALAERQLDAAAAAAYLGALERDASFAPAWNNLAALLRRRGELRLSERALDVVLELEPRNGLAWFNRALIDEARADFERADDAYLAALELQPSLWLPSQNPLIIGNRRAQLVLLRNYMTHGGSRGGVVLDPSPPIEALRQ